MPHIGDLAAEIILAVLDSATLDETLALSKTNGRFRSIILENINTVAPDVACRTFSRSSLLIAKPASGI